MMITVVMRLYSTVSIIINIVGLGKKDHHMISDEDVEQEDDDKDK